MKKAVLLGTSHPIQRGEIEKDSFYSHIHELCKTNNIQAIAEEIDDEYIYIAEDISTELNIKYQIIEPNEEQRKKLGIEDRADIDSDFRFEYKVENYSDELSVNNLPSDGYEKYRKRTENVYRQREAEWLRRINKLNTWPVLIICGTEHYQPFFKLLSKNGIDTVKEASEWAVSQDT